MPGAIGVSPLVALIMASSGGKLLQLFEMHAGEGGDFRFKVIRDRLPQPAGGGLILGGDLAGGFGHGVNSDRPHGANHSSSRYRAKYQSNGPAPRPAPD